MNNLEMAHDVILANILLAASGVDVDYIIMFLLTVIVARLFLCPTKPQVKELARLAILEHEAAKESKGNE